MSLSLEDVPELMDKDRDDAIERVERAIDSIHLAIQDIRNFIFGLRPELLEGTTLVGGLAALIEEYRHNTITEIELETEGQVPGIDDPTFQKIAEEAKKGCPVSKALAGPKIILKAKFLGH